VFKRGKGPIGAYHSSDIPEFYGSSASPDFIGTDALGMFPNRSYYLSVWFDSNYLQSTLPILVTLLPRTTLRASSPMWTGKNGIRQLSIRF
jgi:hypothetical protein